MGEHTIHVEQPDIDQLERVRELHGLASLEEAVELVLKRAIRRLARQSDGRGRALYVVSKGKKQ